MSKHRFTNWGGSLFGPAIVALSATVAFGGTVPIGTFESDKGGFYNVLESGPPANYTPPDPVFTDIPALQLTFSPANFTKFVVETSGTTPFDLQYKSGQVTAPMVTKSITNDPNYRGWEMTGLSLDLGGSYSLNVPFDGGKAKVSMAGQYTVHVTQVDWQPVSIASHYSAPFTVVPDAMTSVVATNGFVNGNWSGSASIDWAALRSAAGILPTQHITGATVQFTTDIGAASIYGSARTSVTNFNINAPISPVAVPEPPTVILAGLGAAAAVGHGYRRRKSRRNAEAGAEMVGDETGAIAITA